MATGPLSGVKVLEFGGIGPGPLCGMLLSDLGADVVRIDRKGVPPAPPSHVYNRGRRSIELDLKSEADVEICLGLCEGADIMFEGFRPGVMERLGLGPETVLQRNPKLVYGRMTGWGQEGPLAPRAGHDINYISITGALHAIGTAEKPVPPLSMIGDFGGGAMFLVLGLVSALLHARQSGEGQVVDAAMCDGANYLMGMTHALHAAGQWHDRRAANIVDGGAPFFDTYRCADGKWAAVGAIEPQFYEVLISELGLSGKMAGDQNDQSLWPENKRIIADTISGKSRDEWVAQFDGKEACFTPVLSLAEVSSHPHNVARGAYSTIDGQLHPAPAPRFGLTPGGIQGSASLDRDGLDEIIGQWKSGA